MERVVRIFNSHREADAADRAYYRSLSPRERMTIFLEMLSRQRPADEAAQGITRVCRIIHRRSS